MRICADPPRPGWMDGVTSELQLEISNVHHTVIILRSIIMLWSFVVLTVAIHDRSLPINHLQL